MGLWYKENFPNSPASKQRLLVARIGILYAVVAGTAIFMFSPFMRQIRKRLSEGEEFVEWDYFREKRLFKKIPGMQPGMGNPKLSEFIAASKTLELLERDDVVGPEASEELIRAKLR